jgi:hypothetical protein
MAYFINNNSEISKNVISCMSMNVMPYLQIEKIRFLDETGKELKSI